MGDRAGEATTLNNMALVYRATGQGQRALALYEEALPILREVGDRAGEANTLTNLAVLLYQNLNRPAEAIPYLQQAITVLETTGLDRAASGTTIETMRQALATMQRGEPLGGGGGGPSTLPAEQIRVTVSNTVAVLTSVPEKHAEWHKAIEEQLQHAQQQGTDWQIEVEFYTAVLAFLDGQTVSLPEGHPYAEAVEAIRQGVAGGGGPPSDTGDVMQAINAFVNADDWAATRQVVEAQQALLFQPEVEAIFEQTIAQASNQGEEQWAENLQLHLAVLRACKQQGIAATFDAIAQMQQQRELPFDPEIIPRSIAALRGGPSEKMAHAQHLVALVGQSNDPQFHALVTAIQHALFGGSLHSLGSDLEGIYAQAWAAIVASVQQGDPPE